MKRTPVCVGGAGVAVGLVAVMFALAPPARAFDNGWSNATGTEDCQL